MEGSDEASPGAENPIYAKREPRRINLGTSAPPPSYYDVVRMRDDGKPFIEMQWECRVSK
jgi:hypothetical protein